MFLQAFDGGKTMASLAGTWSWFGARGAKDEKKEKAPSRLVGFEQDHHELLGIYGEIVKMAVEGRFATIPAELSALKAKLEGHMAGEEQHLYGALERRYAGSPDQLRVIQGFRRDMQIVERGVGAFVQKYRMTGVRPSNGAAFIAELRAMGAMLLHRVRAEESELFPLCRA